MSRSFVLHRLAGMDTIRWVRWLVLVNLGLVALQPLSAGFFMSGYAIALKTHAAVALALLVGALTQAVLAGALLRRRRAPAWLTRFSIGLLLMAFLQVWLGHNRLHWLHVPIGVGMFGGLIRQSSRVDALRGV
jgi:hypothetical protein